MKETADTAEGFLDVERKHVLGIRETFKGKTLAPYSEGIRLLWFNLWEGVVARLAACGLIWMLTRLQEEYDKLAGVKDENARWMHASAALIAELESRNLARAKIIQWTAELGEKGTKEAFLLANKILEEADETDAKDDASAEDSSAEPAEPGNGLASPLASLPT